MPRPPNSPAQFQFRLSGWKAIAVGLVILATIIAALALLAIGFFVIFLPVMILAPVLYYFVPKLRPRRFMRADAARQPKDRGAVIDGDFRVVDARPVEVNPPATDVGRP
jgi:UPF0716 family protein affecting phage T7 exclusion